MNDKTDNFGWGGAAIGKYFVFGPFNYSGVGVLDTESGSVEYYPVELSGCWKNIGTIRGTIFEDDWPYQEICLKGPEGSEEALAGARLCSWDSVQDTAPWGCFAGATALGTKVYFTPFNANEVGVFDTATMSWSLIPLNINLAHYKRCAGCRLEDITGGCLDWDGRYPTGGQCYSCMEGYKYCTNVQTRGPIERKPDGSGWWDGLLRPNASTPSTPAKFVGGAAVGDHIYFAPYVARYVGVLDTVTGVFDLINATQTSIPEMAGPMSYRGAVAVGTKVIFANDAHVGRVLVVDTEKYLSGDPRPLSLSSPLPGGGCRRANAQGYGCSPYWGAAALGKYVFFAPWSEDSVSPPLHSARTLQSAPVSQTYHA